MKTEESDWINPLSSETSMVDLFLPEFASIVEPV